jgi:hypothetical protein
MLLNFRQGKRIEELANNLKYDIIFFKYTKLYILVVMTQKINVCLYCYLLILTACLLFETVYHNLCISDLK